MQAVIDINARPGTVMQFARRRDYMMRSEKRSGYNYGGPASAPNGGKRPRRRKAGFFYILLTLLLSVIFWPAGMIMLWRRKVRWKLTTKLLTSIITLVLCVTWIGFALTVQTDNPTVTKVQDSINDFLDHSVEYTAQGYTYICEKGVQVYESAADLGDAAGRVYLVSLADALDEASGLAADVREEIDVLIAEAKNPDEPGAETTSEPADEAEPAASPEADATAEATEADAATEAPAASPAATGEAVLPVGLPDLTVAPASASPTEEAELTDAPAAAETAEATAEAGEEPAAAEAAEAADEAETAAVEAAAVEADDEAEPADEAETAVEAETAADEAEGADQPDENAVEAAMIESSDEPAASAEPAASPEAAAEATAEPAAEATPEAASEPEATPVPVINPDLMPKPAGEAVVYYNSNGVNYHMASSCKNMGSAPAHTLAEAVERGLRPCRNCGSPEASILEAENVVWVDENNGFHLHADCTEFEGIWSLMTLSDALDAGNLPCAVCQSGLYMAACGEAIPTPTPEPTPTPSPTPEPTPTPEPETIIPSKALKAVGEATVYHTSNGQWYHSAPECKGMTGGKPYDLSECADTHKRCNRCQPPLPELLDEHCLWQDENALCHTSDECPSFTGKYTLVIRDEALAAGLTGCTMCGGSEYLIPNTYVDYDAVTGLPAETVAPAVMEAFSAAELPEEAAAEPAN